MTHLLSNLKSWSEINTKIALKKYTKNLGRKLSGDFFSFDVVINN